MSEIVLKSDRKLMESLLNDVKSLISEEVTRQVGIIQNYHKLEIESIQNTMKTLLSANKMIESQINYKLGNIEGKVKRAKKDDFVMEDLELEDAIRIANKLRAENGLPPLKMPEIDTSVQEKTVQQQRTPPDPEFENPLES